MSSFCHYGCWFVGRCGGVERSELVDFLADRKLGDRVEMEKMSDDELDQFAVDCEDGELGAPHIRRAG